MRVENQVGFLEQSNEIMMYYEESTMLICDSITAYYLCWYPPSFGWVIYRGLGGGLNLKIYDQSTSDERVQVTWIFYNTLSQFICLPCIIHQNVYDLDVSLYYQTSFKFLALAFFQTWCTDCVCPKDVWHHGKTDETDPTRSRSTTNEINM